VGFLSYGENFLPHHIAVARRISPRTAHVLFVRDSKSPALPDDSRSAAAIARQFHSNSFRAAPARQDLIPSAQRNSGAGNLACSRAHPKIMRSFQVHGSVVQAKNRRGAERIGL
jgi:hypothetical protein